MYELASLEKNTVGPSKDACSRLIHQLEPALLSGPRFSAA